MEIRAGLDPPHHITGQALFNFDPASAGAHCS